MDREEQKRFNRKLIDEFGYFSDGKARFRIVWSEDQFEKRLTYHTDEGFELLTPIVSERPKYRQYIHEKWLLEMATIIPKGHGELTVEPISYENIWTFADRKGEYLEPRYEAAKFIINTILGNITSPSNMAKYQTTTEEERQKKIKEIDKIEELLYGNETKIGDALARDSAVGYGTRNRNDGFDPQERLNKATMEN